MARYEFGQGVADYVVTPSDGVWAVGAVTEVTLWADAVEGERYTDLLDAQGQPITSVTSDAYGGLPRFLGPEDIMGMWADAGGGRRAWMDAHSTTQCTGSQPALRLPSESARIDIGSETRVLFRKRSLVENTVVQSFAVDPRTNVVYTSQLISDGVQLADEPAPVPYSTRRSSGDICITQMTLAGVVTGHMYVRGAGHGVALGVETGRDGLTWLWTDADASGSGFARGLHRLQFTDGAVLDSDALYAYRPAGAGGHGVSCSIDPIARLMAVNFTWPDPDDGSGRRLRLFDLDDAAQDRWRPLASVDHLVNQVGGAAAGTLQGIATLGSYVYVLDGSPQGPAYVTSRDWRTGTVVQRQLVTVLSDLTYREPEGLAVWVPDPAAPGDVRLCLGMADGADNARDFSVAYWQAGSPRASVPTPADQGLLAWSIDPGTANSQTSPPSGEMQLVRLRVDTITPVTSVMVHAVTGGAGLTTGLVGIYNASGTLLAQSADQSSSWTSAGTKVVPLTAPVVLPPGLYRVAFLAAGTTTPAWSRTSAQGGNAGLGAPADTRWGRYGTGLTALPPTITLGSIQQASVGYVTGLL